MALFEQTNRLIQADLDNIALSDPDPGNTIEQTIREMEVCHTQLRQVLMIAITSQKRNQQICIPVQQELDKWHGRIQLALDKGREDLAQEASNREQSLTKSLTEFKSQIKKQTDNIKTFKQHLDDLTVKICEARAKQIELRNRSQKVLEKPLKLQPLMQKNEHNEKILLAVDNLEKKLNRIQLLAQEAFSDLSGLKVLVSEIQRTVTSETNVLKQVEDQSHLLEGQFNLIQYGNSLDDELAAIKEQLLGGASPQEQESTSIETETQVLKSELIDIQLEDLKSQLDRL